MEPLFTPATLALRWECSERHVRNLVNDGKLPFFRLGGKLVRIKSSDVERFECQNGGSQSFGENSPSPLKETESVAVSHSAPMMRAKLTSLRQPSTRN
ncbi:excisionase family DNA-binding protein [Agrobacterium vitis]|uniref:DNA-binding protein n=1 Tax=Agrobacterium vitis TaxID=373 RepID=A0A7J4WXR8_AGRVI|nr:DNA-binding protein [Agrobacterium vitis]MUZ95950.1 excisionase family DNA-binding protein [Agrobacterium vitis]